MKKVLLITITLAYGQILFAQSGTGFKLTNDTLSYHRILIDDQGNILPWYSPDPGLSYDFVIKRIWNFWDTIRRDMNGLPYYINHQVWRPEFNDRRGIGGDQLSMALSSWQLLYNYTGNEAVKENMKFIADYYLTHSLSPPDAAWPNIPYPYNTLMYSGTFDGDMILGKNYTQPDKAGSFGIEIVKLYEMTGIERYLDQAILIANTLAEKIKPGNNDKSPMPFKVNAISGETGVLYGWPGHQVTGYSDYTANYAPTLELFFELQKLNKGNTTAYQNAFDILLNWMKNYPLKTNKWGPFFEDIPGWSDTQMNAIKFARFIMEHREYFPDWKNDVNSIFNWVYSNLKDERWQKYGVTVVHEQTVYQVPGNSHTSREAATELLFVKLTGDRTRYDNAVRQLNWATYMVDWDGKNRYPRDEVWLTDGYGDYVRHYLRAMAVAPELAPSNENHILSTTTILKQVDYPPLLNKFLQKVVPGEFLEDAAVYYQSFEKNSTETIRLTDKPSAVLVQDRKISENGSGGDSWSWKSLTMGGVLTVKHDSGDRIIVLR